MDTEEDGINLRFQSWINKDSTEIAPQFIPPSSSAALSLWSLLNIRCSSTSPPGHYFNLFFKRQYAHSALFHVHSTETYNCKCQSTISESDQCPRKQSYYCTLKLRQILLIKNKNKNIFISSKRNINILIWINVAFIKDLTFLKERQLFCCSLNCFFKKLCILLSLLNYNLIINLL